MNRLNRRELLGFGGAGVGLLALPQSVRSSSLPESERPNLLFIFTDQQHAGMMSCAGNSQLKTPAMDSLAATGARFDLAYCANPVCVPSRFSMMTGVMPSRIGMEDNEGSRNQVPEAIVRGSLGRLFRDAGYETAYGGKVHLPMRLQEAGFTEISKDQRSGLADASAHFLAQKHERPFLLVASFVNPHDICYMAINAFQKKPATGFLAEALALPEGMSKKEFVERHCPPLPSNFEVPQAEPDGVSEVDPRAFRFYARAEWTEEDWRLHRWAYCRLTERVDAEVGRVLGALRANRLEEKTVVVFCSDHGDLDSAHRLEHKSVLYEEAARVPFLVSWKGVTKPGLVDHDHLVSTGLDLIPTLCDYASIRPPEGLAGRSVRALAEGRKVASWRSSLAIESKHSRAIRTSRFKYTVYDVGQRREQLVDLKEDPGEMKNLAQDPAYLDVLTTHRNLLKKWYRENGETLAANYTL